MGVSQKDDSHYQFMAAFWGHSDTFQNVWKRVSFVAMDKVRSRGLKVALKEKIYMRTTRGDHQVLKLLGTATRQTKKIAPVWGRSMWMRALIAGSQVSEPAPLPLNGLDVVRVLKTGSSTWIFQFHCFRPAAQP